MDKNGLSLYELNKAMYQNMEPLSQLKLTQETVNIAQWFSKEKGYKYFMLLNNERHDYTIFAFNSPNFALARQELVDLIAARGGQVVAIEYEHDTDAYEIWIKIEDEVYMYMLFDCNDFVIEI